MNIKINRDEAYASKEMIESGVYFSESLKWYNEIFILPSIIRIVYSLFFIAFAAAAYLIVNFTINMFPLKVKKNIVIKTNREPDTYIKSVPLKGYGNPATGVLMYVIKNYIINRESYMFHGETILGTINKKNYFVRNTSSREIYKKFMENNTKANSDMNNLISRNQETAVKILHIKFKWRSTSLPERVYDYFTPVSPPSSAQIDFIKSSGNKASKWRVDITYDFRLFDANHMRQAHVSIPFVVTKYAVRRIQARQPDSDNKAKQ